MKKLFTVVGLGLISLHAIAGSDPDKGYKQNDIDTVRLIDLDNSLKRHSGNIISMRQELMTKSSVSQQTVKEGEYSDSVLYVLSDIENKVTDLLVKQNLLGKMESEQGKSKVAAHNKGNTKVFRAECGGYLKELNLSLSKINSAAFSYEVKSARDDVVNICSIVENWE